MKIYYTYLGSTDYEPVWKLQREINLYKQSHKSEDIILLTQHNHVYTLGKSGDRDHLLINSDELQKENISYHEIDRGGDLTYHGPGQLVCYPILDLKNFYMDSHKYLRDLEEVVIRTLKSYGIDSQRDEGYTGVWVGAEKICAIGIKITRWITMHGLALNVNNDLQYFDNIIPCGIFHKGVTSMKKILSREIDFEELMGKVVKSFGEVFESEMVPCEQKQLKSIFSVDKSTSN
jgi:lipoyl(octanoyl) transferase